MRCYVNSMLLLRREIMIIFKVFLQVQRLLILLSPLHIWKILLNVVEMYSAENHPPKREKDVLFLLDWENFNSKR
jgi:hypothetical protein